MTLMSLLFLSLTSAATGINEYLGEEEREVFHCVPSMCDSGVAWYDSPASRYITYRTTQSDGDPIIDCQWMGRRMSKRQHQQKKENPVCGCS